MPSEDKDISLGLNMVTANYIAKVIFTIDNEDSDPNTVQTFYTRYYVTGFFDWQDAQNAVND